MFAPGNIPGVFLLLSILNGTLCAGSRCSSRLTSPPVRYSEHLVHAVAPPVVPKLQRDSEVVDVLVDGDAAANFLDNDDQFLYA